MFDLGTRELFNYRKTPHIKSNPGEWFNHRSNKFKKNKRKGK